MSDTLHTILQHTKQRLQTQQHIVPVDSLKEQIAEQSPPRGFIHALEVHYQQRGMALITEIKKASPSFGVIRENFDPAQHAIEYTAGGASCLSVLTEPAFFEGAPEHLHAARNACTLPILRKDFIIDAYQVFETRAMGADCLLLIIAALPVATAQELLEIAFSLGLDVLVEVHDETEVEQALQLTTFTKIKSHLRLDLWDNGQRPYDRTLKLFAPPRAIIGVNNRNLKTLKTDLATTLRLQKMLPPQTLVISESGVYTRQDIEKLQQTGVQGFLIGESLMRQENLMTAVQELLP